MCVALAVCWRVAGEFQVCELKCTASWHCPSALAYEGRPFISENSYQVACSLKAQAVKVKPRHFVLH